MFKWKDGTTAEQIQAVGDRLGRLPAEIREIAAYSFGPDLGLSDGASGFAVVADFVTVEDWHASLAHPAHVRVVQEAVAPIRESRVVVQFEMKE
jgi:hypothetical protein